MADAEAAFFAAMTAANEAAGNFEATGGASDQPAESNSDEYDPFHAVPTVQSSANAQASPVYQAQSSASRPNGPLISSSTVPLSAGAVSRISDPPVLDGRDPQSQSRSMSRASSSETSTYLDIKPENQANFTASSAGAYTSPPNMTNGNEIQTTIIASSVNTPEPLDTNAPTPLEQGDVDDLQKTREDITGGDRNDSNPIPKSEGMTVEPKESAGQPVPPSKSIQAVDGPTDQNMSAAPSAPKARLPHDTIGILEDRIKEDQRGDLNAWLELMAEYRKRGKLDDARSIYERFFVVFPSAVSSTTSSHEIGS